MKNKFFFKKEKRNLYYIIIFIFSSIIISSYSSIDYNDLNESTYSYITLKIEKGDNKVVSDFYSTTPKIVYINENKQKNANRKYNFKDL